MRRAALKAFKVLTISEFSRQRIIDWSGIDPSRVVDVSCGVDSCYTPDVNPFVTGFPYFLCVSNRKAHKNEPRILEAFAKAKLDPSVHLLFTGKPNEQLLSLGKQLQIDKRIVFMGRVPEEDLPGLYRGALALVFPTLYEGFGLPVIESMACGTPVITSNTTSLPEVAGDAAIMVDPLSVEQIAAGIEKLYSDPKFRELLIQRGIKQAKKFSWDTVVKNVKDVISELDKGENCQ
jgi:glycosyltransferase involved in cell wall biosynthesis